MIIGPLSVVFVLRFTTSVAFRVLLMVLGLVSAVIFLPRLISNGVLWRFLGFHMRARDKIMSLLCICMSAQSTSYGIMTDKADKKCIS